MTPTVHEFDIAIIGGGMVGASLASLLAASSCGWRIALIEAQPLTPVAQYTANFDARSTALSCGSVEIFQQLGIWSALEKHATPIAQVHVSDRGHLAGSVIDASDQGLNAVGYVIENTWLGSVLSSYVQQQKNIQCFSPAQVQSLTPQQNGAELRIDLPDNQQIQLRCKLAVIADGSDSPLRRALGIDATTSDYGQTAIIANVGFSEAHNGIAYERFTDQGPLALLPLGENPDSQRAALIWTLPTADAQTLMSATDADFLAVLQKRFGFRVGRFERVGQRQAYPLQLILAQEQVRSHVVLVGNAAHFLHPVAGQGFNLALRDCASLVEVLASSSASGKKLGELETLQRYVQTQAQDQSLTIQFSDQLVRLFSSSRLPLIALRHLGFIGLAALPPAKKIFSAQTMGTLSHRPRWQRASHIGDHQ